MAIAASDMGFVYIVYYEPFKHLGDTSPESPFFHEAINTMRYDVNLLDVQSHGYDFYQTDPRTWAFNTNRDAYSEYNPGFNKIGQYNFTRDREYRIGRGRPTIVVLRNHDGQLDEYIEIWSSSDVYNLKNRFRYKK